MASAHQNLRKKQLLDAALACFIRYGYAKTALDDVAQEAKVSRSLLYAYFSDKKDLFISLINVLLQQQNRKTIEVLRQKISKKEKFLRILELWSVDLYALGANSSHGHELIS